MSLTSYRAAPPRVRVFCIVWRDVRFFSGLRAIGDWIAFYNHRRPHQALDMRTPAEAFASAA
uniref:integrase core domain-containing protein n=1 Tax=Cereibacter sphaeroides TaxID=1063 RepID=UPI0018D5204A